MMELPKDFQREILPFIDNDEPTPKDEVIIRILESFDEEQPRNFRSILNYLFAVPARLFFKDENGKITFA